MATGSPFPALGVNSSAPAGECPQTEHGCLPSVWVLPTPTLASQACQLIGVLGAPERERWHDMHPDDVATWLVAHVGVRLVLAKLLGAEPSTLRFAASAHPGGAQDGKPWCVDAPALDFNISHTRSLSCVAVTDHGLIGVDVEGVPTPDEAFGATAERTARMVAGNTTPEERAALEGLAPAQQPAAFLQLWCRKEACAKAVGVGLGVRFNRYSVDERGPSPSSALGKSASTWSVFDLWRPGEACSPALPAGASPTAEAYIGAVALSPARATAPHLEVVNDLFC